MSEVGPEEISPDEMLLLYELSLAIGGALDPVENCQGFLDVLQNRKELLQVSVWVVSEQLSQTCESGLTLLYANPARDCDSMNVSEEHPFFRLFDRQSPLLVEPDEQGGVLLTAGRGMLSAGRFVIWPLAGVGVLEMYAASEDDFFSDQALGRLKPVLDKFAASLLCSLSHQCLQESEKQLKQREKRYRTLVASFEYAQDAIVVSDLDSRMQYVNPAFEKMTGYSVEEAVGSYAKILRSGKHPRSFYVDMLETVRQGNVWRGEVIIRCKDGTLRHVERSVAPVFDDDGKMTCQVNIQRDITEHKGMEEQLLHAQKMESLGTMVGGVAHEFNNALAGMLGRLFLLKGKMEALPSAMNDVDVIERLCFKSADMVKEMLAFARKSPLQKSRFDLSAFVKETFRLYRLSIPENIDVQTTIEPQTLPVQGDATQVQQVIINLLGNARDAVAAVESPAIHLNFELFEPDARFRQLYPDAENQQFAHLSVADNGCGISDEELSHIFDPFYTTKEVGKGTGLGLAMVHGACAMHGGYVDVDSELGVGTVMHVYLPVAEKVDLKAPGLSPQPLQGQGELVLLVDDDAMLRSTGRKVLERLGYQVLEASDGVQGVDLFQESCASIRLVMMDVVMPRMGGVEAVEKMKEIHDDFEVLFCTGYDKQSVLSGLDISDDMVISKPYSIETVSRKLRSLLHLSR